jgi:Na+/H+-dicarboxylate symporter
VSHRSSAQQLDVANRYCRKLRKLGSKSIFYFVIVSTIAHKLGVISFGRSKTQKKIQIDQPCSTDRDADVPSLARINFTAGGFDQSIQSWIWKYERLGRLL